MNNKFYALIGGVTMDENMNKDDFKNDLYDYLWMPEDEQGALYLHQNILFGRAADEEKIPAQPFRICSGSASRRRCAVMKFCAAPLSCTDRS